MRRSRPALGSDIVWGIKLGVAGAALCIVPGAVAYAASFGQPGNGAPGTVARVFGLYLAVGACGGAIAGLARPTLGSRRGAGLVGAATGAVLFSALLRLGGRPTPAPLLGIALGLGAGIGAALGLWFRWRLRVHFAAADLAMPGGVPRTGRRAAARDT